MAEHIQDSEPARVPGSRTSDYDYVLPPERIAQQPVEPRDLSRLLVLDRATGTLAHRNFRDLADLIPANDVLVVNTTRVFRARLLGHRERGGNAEVLLLRQLDATHYEAMVHPGGKLIPGRMVTVAPGFEVAIVETTPRRTRIVELRTEGDPIAAIEQYGHVPLPPYIDREDQPTDATRYQTVYAHESGSVAAPTAGLHFTDAMLERLSARGVLRADVLLHVGPGTFRPVQSDDPAEHIMHEEWCEVSQKAAATIAEARARGGRIWAVGTTSVRTLETAAGLDGVVQPTARETNLFLRPPYTFRAVDHLITNFHLPRSSLLMLVAAFGGYDAVMKAYAVAVDAQYRFYSYGDAMCLL